MPPYEPGDKALILCARVGQVTQIPPGALTGDCEDCGHAVWVSAESLEVTRATGLIPLYLCNSCVPIPGLTVPRKSERRRNTPGGSSG
jgi:hypothetical protein